MKNPLNSAWPYFQHSVIITLVSTALVLLLALPCAYALSIAPVLFGDGPSSMLPHAIMHASETTTNDAFFIHGPPQRTFTASMMPSRGATRGAGLAI